MDKRKKLTPPGKDTGFIRRLALVEGAALTFWSLISFLGRLDSAVSGLKYYGSITLSGMFPWSFSNVLRGAMNGFFICAAAMIGFVIDNYVYFYNGSKSVYTMKRLRNPGRMHLQCWAAPLFWAMVLLVWCLILTGVYFLIYWLSIPAQLRPDSWNLML